jgi:glucose/mannose-6-phosphate isomerase
MLDDLAYIHEKDVSDALGIVEKQWAQLEYEAEVRPAFKPKAVKNIVYAGMGGSALAALLVKTWPNLNKPYEVVRDYDIPAYVDAGTLFIAASYSGNTEETLEALAQAEARGAQIAIIAGGGKLAEIAENKAYPLVLLPKAVQPRYAVLYNFKALLHLLEQAEITKAEVVTELNEAKQFLQASIKAWLPSISTKMNPAKQLAEECVGKSIVIYAGPKLAPAAYKWKISFNENAKQVAWWGAYPEFNHNEFIGWSKQPVDKPYTVIDLRSNLEHERVQKRFEVSQRLLSGMRPAPYKVEVQGQTVLQQLLWTLAYGDFVSLYAAILNGVNPAPVELVEKFKRELNK